MRLTLTLEWLLDRRLLGKNWKQGLPKIREMVAKMEADIPQHIKPSSDGSTDPNAALWSELATSNRISSSFLAISDMFDAAKSNWTIL